MQTPTTGNQQPIDLAITQLGLRPRTIAAPLCNTLRKARTPSLGRAFSNIASLLTRRQLQLHHWTLPRSRASVLVQGGHPPPSSARCDQLPVDQQHSGAEYPTSWRAEATASPCTTRTGRQPGLAEPEECSGCPKSVRLTAAIEFLHGLRGALTLGRVAADYRRRIWAVSIGGRHLQAYRNIPAWCDPARIEHRHDRSPANSRTKQA